MHVVYKRLGHVQSVTPVWPPPPLCVEDICAARL